MNCENVTKNLSLFLYGELPLEDEQALQDHVEACEPCRKALSAERQIHAILDDREEAVPPALLARCRHDLAVRVEAAPVGARGWLRRLGSKLAGGVGAWASLARPVGAVALVALGFFGARWTVSNPGLPAVQPQVAGVNGEPAVMRVRYLQPEPSGQVRLVVEETRQRYLTGDPADSRIQQLLLTAARESSDPGVRADSMEILKQRSSSNEVRDALLHAFRYDTNPGVRLRALDGLKQYAGDAEVRSALAQALLHDDNPGVRTQAIDMLVQQKQDEQFVGVLQELLQKESNSYVRLRSERALREMNASVGTF